MEIRSYSSSRHDRFIGFPTPSSINASAYFDASKFPGVGWRQDAPVWQFALVTRSHLLFATHAAPPIGTSIRFLNASNQLVTRQVADKTVVKNSDDSSSDLILLRLDSPIDESEEVPPLPYLDLPLNNQYLGETATVFGKTARAGSGVYESFAQVSGSNLNPTTAIYFDYDLDSGGNDDARLQTGDSGSPQFAEVNGAFGLVAINSAISIEDNIQSNFGSFVPHYAAELDSMLSPHGYRMTPSRGGNTSISGSTSTSTTTPRMGKPLSITLTLRNTGINTTGNLEVEFQFAAGEGPESITGSNWVNYGSSDDPTVRRGVLNGFSNTTLTLSWSSAPLTETLDWNAVWRSDKSSENSLSESVSLAPSYAAWASGLSEAELTDDPDQDQLLNQVEYAFGGNPEDGSNHLPNSELLRPSITLSGELVTYTFPERSDKAERGLSYVPEWSNDLTPESFSTEPPAGYSSSTSAYDPEIPGFVKRTITWAANDPRQFIRLGVSLAE